MQITANTRRVVLLALLSLTMLALTLLQSSTYAVSAEDNLLRNPSFEGDYSSWTDRYDNALMAPEWTPWWLEDTERDPQWRQPEYKPAIPENQGNRVLDGSRAQQYFTFYSSHYGGVYQQVFDVEPGATYRFQVHAKVWSSVDDSSNADGPVSNRPANPHLQIGIEPNGAAAAGFNNAPSTVQWSEEADMYAVIDNWHLIMVEAKAENSTITVYVKTSPEFAVHHNDIYLDAAGVFKVAGPEAAPAPEPEAAPVEEAAPAPAPTADNGCVIPASGPWPECARGGGSWNPAPSGGGQACPTTGRWPAGCVPGGAPAAQPCPTNGSWPRGCVPTGNTNTNNQPAAPGVPCPTNGSWPRGCVPSGNPAPAPAPTTGQPCPNNGTWPAGCVPSNTPAPAPTTPDPAPAPDPTPAPQPAPVGGGAFEFGGQTHTLANPDLMKDVGMQWVKFQHKWSNGDTGEAVRGRIEDAHARGFKVLLAIPGSDHNNIDFGAYTQFLGEVAALGPDAIEVWNEMNIDREWPAGQISATNYVNSMLKPAYEKIKSVNPDVMVISGAPAPTGYFGGCRAEGCDDGPYIEEMFRAGASNYLDCIGVHYNEGIVPPAARSGYPGGNPNHYTRYYPTMVDTYRAASGNSKPLCFTELGYLSAKDFPFLSAGFSWAANTTVEQHAQWLGEVVTITKNDPNVRMLIIFNVDFDHYTEDDPQAGFAMIRPGGGCPSCGPIKAAMGR